MTNTKNWNFGTDNIEFLSLMDEMIIRDGDGENSAPVCTITIRKRGKVVTPDYLEIGRLIAAAPDLLKALKRSAESLRIASETFGSEKLLSDCMHALAAIAKAEGK